MGQFDPRTVCQQAMRLAVEHAISIDEPPILWHALGGVHMHSDGWWRGQFVAAGPNLPFAGFSAIWSTDGDGRIIAICFEATSWPKWGQHRGEEVTLPFRPEHV